MNVSQGKRQRQRQKRVTQPLRSAVQGPREQVQKGEVFLPAECSSIDNVHLESVFQEVAIPFGEAALFQVCHSHSDSLLDISC